MRERRTFWAILAVVLVLATAIRLIWLQRFYLIPDADQSVLGLMARHIQGGERPVFFWGQPYTGSAEAYLTAVLFAVFGQSNLVLHLVPFAASVSFAGLTVVLAWRLYGLQVAALTGLFLACAPILLIDWGFWAGSGYVEAMALGTGALLLVLPGRACRFTFDWLRRALLACFLLGLAVWIQPTAGYYVIGLLVAVSGQAIGALCKPRCWPAALGVAVLLGVAFCAGASPLLIFNFQHDYATLGFLTGHATSLGVVTVFSRLLLWAGPVLLGLMPPTTDRTYFLQFIIDHMILYGVALALVLLWLFRGAGLWRVLVARLRSIGSNGPSADLPILAVGAATLAGYLGTGWGGEQWAGTQPRYLLPLYTVVPLIIRAGLPLRPAARHWVAAWLVFGCVAAGNIYVNNTSFPRRDVSALAVVLENHPIRAIYGDYWLVYPLIYDSDERIAGVAVGDNLENLHNNRYSPYLRAAAATTDYAWVVATGSAREHSVLACLERLHSRYTVFTWQDQTILSRPTGRAFPWWNGGRC